MAYFQRLGHDCYAWSVLDADPMLRLRAALDRLPPQAAFSQRTAAWLHGLDVPPCDPIQVTVPKECGVSYRSGIAVRRAPLPSPDFVECQGMPVTTITRTLLEIAEARSPALMSRDIAQSPPPDRAISRDMGIRPAGSRPCP